MKIQCLLCGDIIESKSVHDLVCCKYYDSERCLITRLKEYLHFDLKESLRM